MNYKLPSVEYWAVPLGNAGMAEHVARCIRVCKGFTHGKRSATDLIRDCIRDGHVSMLRHYSRYFIVPRINISDESYVRLIDSPYVNECEYDGRIWISTNDQWCLDQRALFYAISYFEVEPERFRSEIYDQRDTSTGDRAPQCLIDLLRHTIVIDTQISTSRELNRTSPNAISELSTRFVDLLRRVGLSVVRPHWYPHGTWRQRFWYDIAVRTTAFCYRRLRGAGLRPEDARGVLALDTATKVVYTYSGREWRHILDLRLRGVTGVPHPNCVEVAAMVRDAIREHVATLNADYDV